MTELIPEIEDPRAQLEAMEGGSRPLASPPLDFDPVNATPEALELYGYPPRPDRETHPELHAFWMRMFEQRPTSEPADFRLGLPEQYYSSHSAGAAGGGSRQEASLNWSGAYLVPRNGRIFTQVLASWHVPTVIPPPGGSPSAEYGSSTWIGLDGQRRYVDSTLPQLGTAQFLNLPGVPGSTTQIWIQWYPLKPVTLPMKVLPGDLVLAWLIAVSWTEALFAIVNASRLSFTSFFLRAPRVRRPPYIPAPVQARITGATAEWVMERPTKITTSAMFELPDFSPVEFNDCYAVAAQSPAGPIQLEQLVTPRLIRMYKRARVPNRTVTIATAERPALDQVQVRYRH
jgi:hypothetical protein